MRDGAGAGSASLAERAYLAIREEILGGQLRQMPAPEWRERVGPRSSR